MIFIYSKPHFNPTVPIYHQCYYALFLTLPLTALFDCDCGTQGTVSAFNSRHRKLLPTEGPPAAVFAGAVPADLGSTALLPWFPWGFQPTTAKVT